MTIAIGTLFYGGAIVCTDTRVVASDGATTTDSKLFASIAPTKRLFLIAEAAEDAYAAKMLGGEISSAICDAKEPFHLGPEIKAVVGPWFNSYHHVQPPQIQFIVASVVVGAQDGQLYMCEPPSTVASGWPIAIGKGARAVDPTISILRPMANENLDAKSTLLRLAYLMYLAKKDEASACGGETHAYAISTAGAFAPIDSKGMNKAEKLAEEVDSVLLSVVREVTGGPTKYPSQRVSDAFSALAKKYKDIDFPSLKFLEHGFWERKGDVSKAPKS